MKRVLALVEEKKQVFAQSPLFHFMQDQRIDPTRRLAFAPCLAPLVMGFADLCKYVFREEPTDDLLQQYINHHTYEEQNHWQWLLEDLKILGFDSVKSYTETLRFLWGDDLKKTRQVCPLLERYAAGAAPAQKLAVVEVAEATANVFFVASKRLTDEIKAITHQKYIYFGNDHLNMELSHNINTEGMVDFIQHIQLNETELQQALEAAEQGFAAYSDAMDEWLAYAQARLVPQLLQATVLAD